VASTITKGSIALGVALVAVAGCARSPVSPLAPPPVRAEIAAAYPATWRAIIRALARENVPLRAIARDSGVIASDEFVTTVGHYADCGRIGSDRIEGEALVSFTLFVEDDGAKTAVLINSKMRTQAARRGSSGKLKPTPVYPCASTGRFEANLLETVQEFVKE
jgi:hypothetical protein